MAAVTLPEPALWVRDLSVRYPGQTGDALRDVSLSLAPGELMTVVGPPGAGATTLALVAARLVPHPVRAAVTGEVSLGGGARPAIVLGRSASQLTGARPTVREEVAFGLENLSVARETMDDRIDRALAAVGIAALEGRSPETLSGGEASRVAIAAALAMAPGLLVLDDPASHLDPAGTAVLAVILAAAAGEGTAVLAAEHRSEILARASRTLLLDRGLVVADDLPAVALAAAWVTAAWVTASGYEPPPILALAAAAGVEPRRAFDEAALAEALREASGRGAPGWPPSPSPDAGADTVSWLAIREHPAAEVEVTGLVHRYPNGVVALHGVDLAVQAGEAVAVVGANGSGKTTLVKHLNGLLRPSTGSVRVGGADVATQPVHRNAARVGFAFADAEEMLFGRTVEAEVRFGPRALGLPVDQTERLVEAALAATGLVDRRTASPHDLGAADQRLVVLAAILAADPAVVVLDEPTSGLDGWGVRRVGAVIDALRGAGRTVVAVTHDMELAARHFDRVAVLRGGRVVLDGSPRVVFAPDRAAALAEAGVRAPLAARIAARLGIAPVSLDVPELLDRLARRQPGPRASGPS